MTDSANTHEPLAARMRRRADDFPLQRAKEARERYDRLRMDMRKEFVNHMDSMTANGVVSFRDVAPSGVVKRFVSFVDLFVVPDDETMRALYDDLKAFAQLPENQFKWVENKEHVFGCGCGNGDAPCTVIATIGV